MNPRLFWMASACLIALGSAPTLAFPSYRLQAVKQLKLEPDKADGTMVVGCVLCHINPEGGDPWNAFGQRVQAKLGGDFAKTLLAVLSELRDSDGDGYNVTRDFRQDVSRRCQIRTNPKARGVAKRV